MKIVENQLSNPESIRSQFLMTATRLRPLLGRSTFVDQLVTHAFRTHLAPAFPHGMSVLAVGGYGRRELFPYSDIDLLLLVDKEVHGDDPARRLCRPFYDRFGITDCGSASPCAPLPSAASLIKPTSNSASASSTSAF